MKFKCGTFWWYININPPSASLHMNISIITNLVCANYNRVDWLNIEHLSTQGKVKWGEGSTISGVQTKLQPLFLAHLIH